MTLKELLEQQISKITTEEIKFVHGDGNEVGCGGWIWGGGSCGKGPSGGQ